MPLNSWSQGIKLLSDEWNSWLDKTRMHYSQSLVAAGALAQTMEAELHFDILACT